MAPYSREVSVKQNKKNTTVNSDKNNDKPAKPENKAITSFETFFYRFVAWFPILVLPALVWEMLAAGEMVTGSLIGLMHAVLVFRFVQVVSPQSWFGKKVRSPQA